jgi:hypothetical protein
VAHADKRGLFWPKDFEVVPEADGRFQRLVYEGGSGGDVVILLLLASAAGHVQLTERMAECSRTGRYPGIPPEPARFAELNRVRVRHDPTRT